MVDINLTISLWGRERKVEVKYFQGQIFRRGGAFVIEYNVRCDLCGDDLQGLFDVLE